MLRINTAQQFALVEAESDGVIRLPRSWLPRWFLARQHDREAIRVREEATINGLVQLEQPCLVCEELAHSDSPFVLLRELRPVRGHTLFIVEPTTRVCDGERHRREAFRGGVDDDHGVLLPRLARLLVSDTAPQVDDVLASVKGAARSADLASPNEVLSEHLAHGLEAEADVPLNTEAVGRRRTDDGAGWGHTFCDHAASFIFLRLRSARRFQLVDIGKPSLTLFLGLTRRFFCDSGHHKLGEFLETRFSQSL